MNTATAENFLFDDMRQAKETSTPIAHFKAEIARLQDFTREHDGVLYPNQVAVALGVSPQCVQDLLDRDKLAHTVIFGRKVVSCNDVLTRMLSKTPDKGGRPRTVRGAIALGVDLTKAAFQK